MHAGLVISDQSAASNRDGQGDFVSRLYLIDAKDWIKKTGTMPGK